MEQIIVENIPISFIRKNIRNINIRIVEPNGEVKVSAPSHVSMRRVEKFIVAKKNWILSSQKKVIEKSKKKSKSVQDLMDINNFSSEKEQNELKKFYANELLEQAKPYFEKWQKLTGLSPNKVVVRWTKTVWGSCNKKTKRIMLNGQLVGMDKRFLDYVILHELTHLKYSNHGQDFKNFMSKYMPEWKEIRKELNG